MGSRRGTQHGDASEDFLLREISNGENIPL